MDVQEIKSKFGLGGYLSCSGSYKRAGHIAPPPVAYTKFIPPWGIGLTDIEPQIKKLWSIT